MVKFNCKPVILIITGLLFISTYGQENHKIPFDKYSNWGGVVAVRMYQKASSTTIEGSNEVNKMENKNGFGYAYGLYWNFKRYNKVSLSTGLLISRDPAYSFDLAVKWDDKWSVTPAPAGEEITYIRMKSPVAPIISFPLIADFQIFSFKESIVSLKSGLRMFWLPFGSSEVSVTVVDEVTMRSNTIFSSYAVSSENQFHFSGILGLSILKKSKRFLYKFDLDYTLNFQNLLNGEYQFANLIESPPSRGTYSMSGNYLSLSFTVMPRRSKKYLKSLENKE